LPSLYKINYYYTFYIADLSDDQLFANNAVAAKAVYEYADHARARSTSRAYKGAVRKYEEWASAQRVRPYPASGKQISLFLATMALESRSPRMIERMSAAITAEHSRRDLASPTGSPLLRDVVRGIKRKHGTAPDQAPEFTKEMLRGLLGIFNGTPEPSLLQWRTAWSIFILFLITGRWGDFKKLLVNDFTFKEDGTLLLCFKSLKNVPVSKGFKILITPNDSNPTCCPVRMTQAYFAALGLKRHHFVLPVLTRMRGTYIVQPLRQASDFSIRTQIRNVVRQLGHDPSQFKLHSIRRGSAAFLQDAGFHNSEVAKRVGWQNTDMSARYTSGAFKKQAQMCNALLP